MSGTLTDNQVAQLSRPVATPLALSARTATGQSTSQESPPSINGKLAILARVTAVSGTTPSLTLSVEWSNDGVNFAQAETADAFTAITAASSKVKTFDIKAKFYRAVYTITGTTPSFTFEVTTTGQ